MLDDYIINARNNHRYDFKVTNGTSGIINDINPYRGMPIGVNGKGQPIYTSARDIGNIVAGYVAAINGLSWEAARIGFDGYQSITSKGPKIEGISTRNAEYYGWKLGYNNNTTTFQNVNNLGNSILNTINKVTNKAKSGWDSLMNHIGL